MKIKFQMWPKRFIFEIWQKLQIKREYFLFIYIFHILTKFLTKKNIDERKGYKINVENTKKFRRSLK
jgi:hypothetical protein